MTSLFNYRMGPVDGDDSNITVPGSRDGRRTGFGTRNSEYGIPLLGSRRGGRYPLSLDSTSLTAESIYFGRLSSFRHPEQLDIDGWQEETFPVLISSVHGT
jgi:hypothetical protein